MRGGGGGGARCPAMNARADQKRKSSGLNLGRREKKEGRTLGICFGRWREKEGKGPCFPTIPPRDGEKIFMVFFEEGEKRGRLSSSSGGEELVGGGGGNWDRVTISLAGD